jgi:hypothetical protein
MALVILSVDLFAQVEAPVLNLRRGMLWSSYNYAKSCPPFSNWTRIGYGLDWPGYDPEWVGANVGGYTSYMTTGGIWFAARDTAGRVMGIDDWAMYGSSVTPGATSRYKVLRHAKRWKNGENYWFRTNPAEAEEIIETEFEANPDYVPQFTGDLPLPVRVRRSVRQWSGSQRDENFIIVEYVIKNASDSVQLRGAYAMVAYALGANYRGWSTLFPNLNQGPRNNRFTFDPVRRMIFGFADDYPLTTTVNEKYDYYPTGGPEGKGEYLAPGYPGIKLLYSSPDTINRSATRVSRFAWSAAPDQQDLYGPFGTAAGGLDFRYQVVSDPTRSSEAITSPGDPRWATRRVWSLMTLGPWTLHPGDSVVIALAEFVAGVPYDRAVDPNVTQAQIGSGALAAINSISARSQMAYDNRYRIPKPPAAPAYTIRLNEDPAVIGNIIEWTDASEAIPDPDYTGQEAFDLAGYKLYRSSYLPLGPWVLVADIPKGSARYKSGNRYTYLDTAVAIGQSYYYAVTAYDQGHSSWPPNRSYRFFETGSNAVPPLESSIYASLYARSSVDQNVVIQPFKTTIPAAENLEKILVVPNPFVLESGAVAPASYNVIQFINVPNPCTIRIYTIRGDLVKTIRHQDGSGIALWNQQTDYGQFVGSGVYVYHIETPNGQTKMGKLGIVR